MTGNAHLFKVSLGQNCCQSELRQQTNKKRHLRAASCKKPWEALNNLHLEQEQTHQILRTAWKYHQQSLDLCPSDKLPPPPPPLGEPSLSRMCSPSSWNLGSGEKTGDPTFWAIHKTIPPLQTKNFGDAGASIKYQGTGTKPLASKLFRRSKGSPKMEGLFLQPEDVVQRDS